MCTDPTEMIKKLEHENEMLKNRCAALTEGTMCHFCPYQCERRRHKYRGQME